MTKTLHSTRRTLALLAASTLLLASGARAHVALETPSAIAGTSYKAVLLISHGCEGQPTHTVTVRLPSGFKGAKPMPKPGWALSIRREPLAQPYTSHGKTVTDDVTEVVWTARSDEARLPDAQYDEFVLRGQLPATAGPLWFKVQQLCPSGQLDWVEVPASGTSTKGMKAPAVLLNVEPAAPSEHAHH
ncbi:YcnI family copper-binding membrane protein [Sphaerotilus sp.]|uniref:YcnI family copper-binding membrane protein n=1 Tax=Sphaerotilus sp. TaxID=2093942 RepID=UPI0025DB1436|nr:YcnI family protein [Sphaerotilus sp.]